MARSRIPEPLLKYNSGNFFIKPKKRNFLRKTEPEGRSALRLGTEFFYSRPCIWAWPDALHPAVRQILGKNVQEAAFLPENTAVKVDKRRKSG